MTNPEGLVVELAVEKNIPYLQAGSEFSQPRDARESKVVPISTMIVEEEHCMGAESDEEDTLADAADDLANARRHARTNQGKYLEAPSSDEDEELSLIHIPEPTSQAETSKPSFCLKKQNTR